MKINLYKTPPPPNFIVLASSVTIMEVKDIEFHRIGLIWNDSEAVAGHVCISKPQSLICD